MPQTKTNASFMLVELFFKRDESAIAITQSEYGEYCFAVANNILCNELDAEECVNDAYLRVWNSIPPAKPNNFKAFIAKITRNLAVDRLKYRTADKRNASVIAFEELEEVLASDCGTISEQIALTELQDAINRFLYTCAQRDRAIFLMRYFYFYPVSAIAEKMGTKESNTSKILTSTREKLREYLKKEGYYV